MHSRYIRSTLAHVAILFCMTIITLGSRRPPLQEFLNVTVPRPLVSSEGEDAITSVLRRTGILTGSAGDFDLTPELSNQMLPIQIAAGVIRVSTKVSCISINHSLTDIPAPKIFRF